MSRRARVARCAIAPCEAPPRGQRLVVGLVGGLLVVASSWQASFPARDRWWAAVGTVLLALALAEALPVAQRLLPRPGALPLAIAAAAVATYGCVPETDQLVPVGICVGGVALVELASLHRLPIVWHASVAGLVLWAGIYGATGRQSALVGALFAFWPVLIVPVVAALRPSVRRTREPARWLIAVIGAGAAVAVARTGALQPTIGPALVAAAVWGGVSLAAALAVARATTRFARP
jgi:hypothetical protein